MFGVEIQNLTFFGGVDFDIVRSENPCHSEVTNFDLTAVADKDISWLEVTVHHTCFVKEVQST
jgi:hypothetical protein